MMSVSLFKVVSALTPDDIKQMKAAGCEDDAKQVLNCLGRMAAKSGEYGQSDRGLRVVLQQKLDELYATLSEG